MKKKTGGLLLRIASLYLLLALVSTANWFNRRFGRVEIEQVLFHLQQSSEGLFSADAGLVAGGIRNGLQAPVAYAAFVIALYLTLHRCHLTRGVAQRLQAAWRHPLGHASAFAVALAWTGFVTLAWPASRVERRDWIAQLHAPVPQVAAAAKPRNLVLIYAESLEATYDSPAFPERLLAPLALPDFEGGSVSFGQFRQLAGTGWTIAGIVATQCGLPLKPLGIVGENWVGETTARFIPGARCLGDVLREQGYHNVFMGGASLDFAGKGSFLRAHGYEERWGLADWRAIDPDAPLNDWGLHDDALFAAGLRRLRELAAMPQPFNLTLLTVGMHFPHGFLAPSCPATHGDMRDTVACTSRLIRDFIDAAGREGLLDHTTVVIVGDHLGMESELSPRLEAAGPRHVYNRILNPATRDSRRDTVSHFDMFPTLLTALGFQVEEGRAALGCSALGRAACQSLAQDPLSDDKLRMQSDFYDGLWTAPEPRELAPLDAAVANQPAS